MEDDQGLTEVGERIVEMLIAAGVTTAFGVPGGQTCALYNGMARHRSEIRHVLMRDERSAAFAADAWARVTGRTGVCDATVGPGASNLVSGLVEALCSSIPMLAIVADIDSGWEHRRHLGSASQAFEQAEFLRPCSKWLGRVAGPEATHEVLENAFLVATSGRPGPVVIEVPDDVFSAAAPGVAEKRGMGAAMVPRLRPGADPSAVAEAVAAIVSSSKPAILIGGGAHLSGAGEQVLALVDKLGVPFVTTPSGKGIVAETHDLSAGVCGSFGTRPANDVLASTDCLVVIGAKLGQAATLGWEYPASDATVVHIDIDPSEIGRNHRSIGITGDGKICTQALVDALVGDAGGHSWDLARLATSIEEWWYGPIDYKCEPSTDAVKPQAIVAEIGSRMGPEDLVVTDASLSSGWVGSRLRTRFAGRRILSPRGLAGLGWGLPAAVGAAFALRDLGSSGRVFCVSGDGGWGYSMAEVETLARFDLPVVSIVLNNGVLGWNKHVMDRRYDGEHVSQHLSQSADYGACAEALGAFGQRVDSFEAFTSAFAATLAELKRPSVIDVVSSPHETPVLKSMSGGGTALSSY